MSNTFDLLRLILKGGPGCCNVAVTSACNAHCDFCGYSVDRQRDRPAWIDTDRFGAALDILRDRDIRYITLTGGEPTLHRRLPEMVAAISQRGMRAALVTNGSRLSVKRLDLLRSHGLQTLFISIDASTAEAHEQHRGLPWVCERIRGIVEHASARQVSVIASVTLSRMVHDLGELFGFLRYLGFSAVTFAYPKRELHSTSRVFSSSSHLIDYTQQELIHALGRLRDAKDRSAFPILNPKASITDMIHLVSGAPQLFPCIGGFKYFYMNYRYDIYRCDFWREPICSVWQFRDHPFDRNVCTQCMSGCYRDASVLMQPAVSFNEFVDAVGRGHPLRAIKAAFRRRNIVSLRCLIADRNLLRRLAVTGRVGSDVGERGQPPELRPRGRPDWRETSRNVPSKCK